MQTTCGAAPRWCPGAPDRVLRKQVLLECFLPLGCGGRARSPCSLLPSGRAQLQARPAGWKPTATGHNNAGLSWDRPHSSARPSVAGQYEVCPWARVTGAGAVLAWLHAIACKTVASIFTLESYCQLFSPSVVPMHSTTSSEC